MEGSAGRRCGRAGFGYKNGSIPSHAEIIRCNIDPIKSQPSSGRGVKSIRRQIPRIYAEGVDVVWERFFQDE